MKRWALAVAIIGVLIIGAFIALSANEAPVTSALSTENVEARASPTEQTVEAVSAGASIRGRVLNKGVGVSGARVVLKGSRLFFATTLPDGDFLFDALPAGSFFVSASWNELTSEVIGPIALQPTSKIDHITLDLSEGIGIRGRVLDLTTGEAIPKAIIVTSSGATTADAKGTFKLHTTKTQTWIEISAPEYLSRSEWISLELARSGGSLEIRLARASRIEGTVTEMGRPVPRASVWAELLTGSRRGERSHMVLTDDKGQFSIECADGRLVPMAATPSGIRIRGQDVRLAIGEKKTGVVLDAGDVTSILGVVTKHGAPLAGATVAIIDAKTEDVLTSVTTLQDGRFQTGAAALGRYVAQVRRGSITSMSSVFEHRGDGALWTIQVASKLKLSGRVEPPTAGVRVRWRGGAWSGPEAEVTTDASGHFEFESVSEGMLSIDAEGPAGSATTRARAGDDVVLQLGSGPVVVHLQDDSGAIISDGVLLARNVETGAVRRFMVLAPDGVYRLSLPIGEWDLRLEVAGRGRSAAARITVTPVGVDVRLSLEPGVALRGVVVDAATKLPIRGARVRVFTHAEWWNSTANSTITNDRGEFATGAVPQTGFLQVDADGFVVANIALQQLSPSNARIELARGAPPPDMTFEGIGMTIDARDGKIMAAATLEGSPAERAGIQRGDILVGIDGAPPPPDLQQTIQRIRGPSGTSVRLSFNRHGTPFEVNVIRRTISPM